MHVQNQLEFDVIDTSAKNTLGGFSYIIPPEEDLKIPQNAEEAYAFRQKYFKVHGIKNKIDYIIPPDMTHQHLTLDFCRYGNAAITPG